MAIDNAMRNILDAAREYGFYVDRGDPAATDFVAGDFIFDSAWRDLDLSSIIPVNAHAAHLTLIYNTNIIQRRLYFRKKDNVNAIVVGGPFTQIANIFVRADIQCALNADRVVQYNGSPAVWNFVNVTVKGWWY